MEMACTPKSTRSILSSDILNPQNYNTSDCSGILIMLQLSNYYPLCTPRFHIKAKNAPKSFPVTYIMYFSFKFFKRIILVTIFNIPIKLCRVCKQRIERKKELLNVILSKEKQP